MFSSKEKILSIFDSAGVEVNGKKPSDIQVHNERLYGRLVKDRSLGLGEAYMEGWWDAERIDLLVARLLSARAHQSFTFPQFILNLKASILNLQSKTKAREVIDKHYDLDNELYMSFLDPYNQYTCGYFEGTEDLNEAQEKKLDLICRKLQLKEGERMLDIGCGWGGLVKYAAEKYGARVTGVSISDEQIAYAKDFTRGLPVEIRKQDYRDLKGEQFDKITCVGMIEHVGAKNHRTFMKKVSENLKDDGLFLLHTIGSNKTSAIGDAWSNKYIFPNGLAPSMAHIAKASEGVLVMEDWHNFGPYYVPTLHAWDQNFQRNWPELKDRYANPDEFYRMFRYYFNSFAGAFDARTLQLWQVVFSKAKAGAPYKSVR